MTVEARIARIFRLDDRGWARHANPWSGWTRFATCLPLLVVAVWSRVWIGPWAVLSVALAFFWIWVNPRAFGPVADDGAWMARGVLGERLWSERRQRAVPERHRLTPHPDPALSFVPDEPYEKTRDRSAPRFAASCSPPPGITLRILIRRRIEAAFGFVTTLFTATRLDPIMISA